MLRPVGAYQVSPMMLEAFREEGFADVQIGKEAVFDLNRFTLAGGKMELVRAATNKARREGLVVSEHHPFAKDAETINDELREISEAWLKCKGNQELGFVLGSLGLDSSIRQTLFHRASDETERDGSRALSFVNRFMGAVVITSTSRGAGTMPCAGLWNCLTAEILRLLHEEGCEMASMGLAPLALLDDPDLLDHPVLARLMRFVYERVNINYDFKLLYRYKAKYHPHTWEPRYFCFNQRRLSLSMLYAVIQVRNALKLEMLLGRRGFPEKIKTWKHAASFIVGFCWALLSSSS